MTGCGLTGRLSRDRAAARLRRMRKKASIETTEIKIEFIKNRIKALQVGVVDSLEGEELGGERESDGLVFGV